MSKLEILAEYGYHKDPFRGAHLETADSLRVKRVVSMAVDSRGMISIVADRGTGKTRAIEAALRGMDAAVVRLLSSDKEQVRVGEMERALIIELSAENVKRTREVRARQLRRILGEVSRQRPVVLVLEEAHRMHGQTLRSLKTLREMEWMGVWPLFTVIMIGQYDPMRKRGVDEVRLRTDTIYMKGLTGKETAEYIAATVGNHFDADAISAMSRLSRVRNFLELQEMLTALMGRALENGNKSVSAFEVFELYGGGLKEIMTRANVTLADLEKETKLSKPAISLIVNDKQHTMNADTVTEAKGAIAEVLRRRLKKEGHEETPEKKVELKAV